MGTLRARGQARASTTFICGERANAAAIADTRAESEHRAQFTAASYFAAIDLANGPALENERFLVEYSEFRAMNSDILLAAEGERDLVARGFAQARELIAAYEARLSRFVDTSELSRLNRSNGAWFNASDELFEIVKLANDLTGETDRLYDPTILDALENVGYDKSMDDIRARGVTRPARPVQHAAFDFGSIEFNATTRSIRLVHGTRIDLGGIAKGWLAERAARRLAEFCDACAVDAGGDMFVIGLPAGENVWRVALEDPREAERTLAVVRVRSGAIATSTITKRRWQQGDDVRHHLIDPRTGLPAETDCLSVTAFAPHAAVAEVFAKALLIAGSREAARIAACREDVAFIAVDREGKLWGSEKAKEFLDVGITCG
jgi:thiamine biosynthesis lipoprotein